MGKGKKRAVKDVPIFTDKIFETLREIFVNFKVLPYKTQMGNFVLRDKALFCSLFLIGTRASETCLKKKQFLVKSNEVILANVETLKNGDIRREVILPRLGSLGVYTETLVSWLEQVPEINDYIFPSADAFGSFKFDKPLGRKRIWYIIHEATGLFPHWFRGVHETIYGRLVFKNDAWKLKDHMGLKRLDSTAPYVRGEMEKEDKQRLKTL